MNYLSNIESYLPKSPISPQSVAQIIAFIENEFSISGDECESSNSSNFYYKTSKLHESGKITCGLRRIPRVTSKLCELGSE